MGSLSKPKTFYNIEKGWNPSDINTGLLLLCNNVSHWEMTNIIQKMVASRIMHSNPSLSLETLYLTGIFTNFIQLGLSSAERALVTTTAQRAAENKDAILADQPDLEIRWETIQNLDWRFLRDHLLFLATTRQKIREPLENLSINNKAAKKLFRYLTNNVATPDLGIVSEEKDEDTICDDLRFTIEHYEDLKYPTSFKKLSVDSSMIAALGTDDLMRIWVESRPHEPVRIRLPNVNIIKACSELSIVVAASDSEVLTISLNSRLQLCKNQKLDPPFYHTVGMSIEHLNNSTSVLMIYSKYNVRAYNWHDAKKEWNFSFSLKSDNIISVSLVNQNKSLNLLVVKSRLETLFEWDVYCYSNIENSTQSSSNKNMVLSGKSGKSGKWLDCGVYDLLDVSSEGELLVSSPHEGINTINSTPQSENRPGNFGVFGSLLDFDISFSYGRFLRNGTKGHQPLLLLLGEHSELCIVKKSRNTGYKMMDWWYPPEDEDCEMKPVFDELDACPAGPGVVWNSRRGEDQSSVLFWRHDKCNGIKLSEHLEALEIEPS